MAQWLRIPLVLAMATVVAPGCQRLPEESDPSDVADSGDSTEGEFPPSVPGADSTSGGPGDQTDCVQDREVVMWTELSELAGAQVIGASITLTDVANEDLDWLQCVEQIAGDLRITQSPSLTDLSGLRRLRSVGFTLEISDSSGLQDLDELSRLNTVGALEIADNQNLQNVDGITDLVSATSVAIKDNPNLTAVHLAQLTTLNTLTVTDNESLEFLELTSLAHVVNDVAVWGSTRLDTVAGLSTLEEIGGRLQIGDLDRLVSTAGLSSLRDVGSFVAIADNPMLEQVQLPLLERANAVIVATDPVLTSIEIPALTDVFSIELRELPALAGGPVLTALTSIREMTLQQLPMMTSLAWIDFLGGSTGAFTVVDLATLADLTALEGVQQVSNELVLSGLPSLTTLDGLSALQSVGGGLELTSLPLITSLQPLSALTEASVHPADLSDPALALRDLDGLTSLAGLGSLAIVGGSLEIVDVDALTSMSGIVSLTEVTGNIVVASNPALVDLGGLESVHTVGGTLTIRDNASLADLDGAEGLDTLTGGLLIEDNPALVDLAAMWPVPTGTLQFIGQLVVIQRNGALSQCHVDEFVAALLALGEPLVVESSDNLPCNP